MQTLKPFTILIAEDDEDDYLLTMEALKEAGVHNDVHWVKDGEELLDYLDTAVTNGNGNGPRLGMILLDLNMPKKDGREALGDIKAHPSLKKIPVVIMTTSKAESDITQSYELGVNSFIQKPVRFHDLVHVIKVLADYWFDTVKLPI
ncbi:MAG: response regulator [Nitrospinaceae bacterium]|nr:response regulator [Nitrospinaceae bacterium]NIR54507.1 response regulator [Nitrospinaceae bacterium]NIS84926.1 response regulator [Nitrospinaceae bacterium]NIT81740.1 response regulator [Nitrospinaceae bacterium]NIU44009.1 response regulator [Nitrospinaceae bacterium]